MKIRAYLLSLLLLPLIGLGVAVATAYSQKDRVLAQGNPPLTQTTVDKAIAFLEWSLDIQLPVADTQKIQNIIISQWESGNRAFINGIVEGVESCDQIRRPSEVEQKSVRDQLRVGLLESIRRDSDNELNRMLLGAYETSRSPKSPTTSSPEKSANRSDWRTVRIGKFGVESIVLPVGLLDVKESTENHSNQVRPGVSYSRIWEMPGEGILPLMSVDILVTTQKKRMRFEPELLMKFLYNDGERFRLTEEVKYLELDQVRGVFTLARRHEDGADVSLNWSVHRDYQGKEQYIGLGINGPKSRLPELLKILHSLKFQ